MSHIEKRKGKWYIYSASKWETDREQNSLGRGAGYGSNIQFTKKLYNNDKTI